MTIRRRADGKQPVQAGQTPALESKIIPAAPIRSKKEALREVLIPSPDPESALYKQQVSVLERRLTKLNRVIAEQQALLARLESGGGPIGIASKFRVVQGLSMGEGHLERKREMMRTIFEANLELRDSIIS